jgi:hypothetical protein
LEQEFRILKGSFIQDPVLFLLLRHLMIVFWRRGGSECARDPQNAPQKKQIADCSREKDFEEVVLNIDGASCCLLYSPPRMQLAANLCIFLAAARDRCFLVDAG